MWVLGKLISGVVICFNFTQIAVDILGEFNPNINVLAFDIGGGKARHSQSGMVHLVVGI